MIRCLEKIKACRMYSFSTYLFLVEKSEKTSVVLPETFIIGYVVFECPQRYNREMLDK